MALALTDAGEAAAYVPMELDDPPEDEEERDPAFADAMAIPVAADEEGDQVEREESTSQNTPCATAGCAFSGLSGQRRSTSGFEKG